MRRLAIGPACVVMAAALFFPGTPLCAAPVARADAYRAAQGELPRFFTGFWQPAGELALQDLAGQVAAYVFIFVDAQKKAGGADETPAAFVARVRAQLGAGGRAVSGNEPELSGSDRYATIFISADDTEPVILRCFRGLPPQVVKEYDARALAEKGSGRSDWQVSQYLMLGFFDEAFSLTAAAGAREMVVDMRTRSTASRAEMRARALAPRAAAPDAERLRLCQEAWRPYRAAGPRGAAAAGTQKSSAVDLTPGQTPQPPPNGP